MIKIILKFLFLFFISCSSGFNFHEKDFIEVTDQFHRKVKVKKNVERIVTTYGPSTAFIFQLDLSKKLVSVGNRSSVFSVFKKLRPEVFELPFVGSKKGLNIETIVSQRPDLVVLFPSKEAEKYAQRLEELNVPSVIIKPESSAQINETFTLLAQILNKEKKAKKIINSTNELITQIKSVIGKMQKRKKVYFASSGDFFSAYTRKMLQGDMIEMAGCENVAKDLPGGVAKISSEQLLSWDPDIIVLSQGSFYKIDSIFKDKRFKNLTAVKNKKIFKMPSNLEPFDYPSGVYILGVIWLSVKSYPDLWNININDVFDSFYTLLYGRSFSSMGGKIE